jgi:hypothetical protein
MQRIVNHLIVSVIIFCLFAAGDVTAAMKDIKPSVACNYLASIGLSTRGWKSYYDDVYSCSSPYKEFGSGYPLKNNLAYYVEGTATAVKQLKLVVNVNNRAEAKEAHAELLKAAEVLVKKSLNESLSDSIHNAITNGKNMSSKIGDATVEVVRDNWPTGKGYEIKVIIK